MNFLDIVIIGLLLLGGLDGYRKGLINSLVSVGSIFVAAIVALIGFKQFIPVIDQKLGFGKVIENLVASSFTQSVLASSGSNNPTSVVAGLLPPKVQGTVSDLLNNLYNSTVQLPVHNVGTMLARYFTVLLLGVTAFLIIFAICYAALRIIGKLLTRGLDRTIVGGLNHAGGFLFGAIGAIIMLSIAMTFLTPIISIFGEKTFVGLLQQSVLTPYMLKVFHGLAVFFQQIK